MKMMNSLRNRLGAAAFAVGALAPAGLVPARPVDDTPIRVTPADVEWSNQKITGAYSALVDMWTRDFNQIGKRFDAPRLLRYSGAVRTACGVMQPNNAQYCQADNAIFYDELFVAAMAKMAGNQLHTDGDMTGIGIIAHETGHAVAFQLGHHPRDSYANESTADCFAGAFANQAERDKDLEDGDMEEALLGMEMSGDPDPEPTGNRRRDAVVAKEIARQSHGTKEQRVQNFQNGFRGGPGACLNEFKSIQ